MAIHLVGAGIGAVLIAATTYSLLSSNLTESAVAPTVQPAASAMTALPSPLSVTSKDPATALAGLIQQTVPSLKSVDSKVVEQIGTEVAVILGPQASVYTSWASLREDYSRAFRCMNYQYNQWYMRGLIERTASVAAGSDPSLAAIKPQMGFMVDLLSSGIIPTASDCQGLT